MSGVTTTFNRQSANTTDVLASVVILTRNRAVSLDRALAAVRLQTYSNYEIVVVDNDSTDHTQQVIATYGARHISVSSRYGIGYCRGQGVQAARGEIIAFIDDDCVPATNWLESFVHRLLQEPEIGLLGGHVINVGFIGAKVNKGKTKLGRNGKLSFVNDPNQADFFGNMNLAFRRDVIEKVGNYDPFLTMMEEIDLATRVSRHGYRVTHEPTAIVEHHHTGRFFKMRHIFWGPQLVRLYFFMKHFRPNGIMGWGKFIASELQLFAIDLHLAIRALAAAIVKRKFERLSAISIEFFNLFTARLAVPWLMRRAKLQKQVEAMQPMASIA